MKKKVLHLVCNAHIDPVWQWDWNEGVTAALATFWSAAELAEEFDYIFCHNEALLYEYIEKYAPDLFEKIRVFATAGKWHVTGGWYLQPTAICRAERPLYGRLCSGKNISKKNSEKNRPPRSITILSGIREAWCRFWRNADTTAMFSAARSKT